MGQVAGVRVESGAVAGAERRAAAGRRASRGHVPRPGVPRDLADQPGPNLHVKRELDQKFLAMNFTTQYVLY